LSLRLEVKKDVGSILSHSAVLRSIFLSHFTDLLTWGQHQMQKQQPYIDFSTGSINFISLLSITRMALRHWWNPGWYDMSWSYSSISAYLSVCCLQNVYYAHFFIRLFWATLCLLLTLGMGSFDFLTVFSVNKLREIDFHVWYCILPL
jgi:hypothetical protein